MGFFTGFVKRFFGEESNNDVITSRDNDISMGNRSIGYALCAVCDSSFVRYRA